MRYTIENEALSVTVDSKGAELVSVVNKATGAEMMWDGQKEVWSRHAPILFPYCGRLKDGQYTLDGQRYEGGPHGFARDLEHTFLGAEGNRMGFVLRSDERTLARFPRPFALESVFTLEGNTLRQTITVTNLGTEELRFGLGFHPAFALPFDDAHTTADYEFRFDTPQTPVVIETGASTGLVTGETRVLMEKSAVIPMEDRMFDHDSICLSQLSAKELSVVEKDTGRKVTVALEGFPYTLLWSAPGNPALHFVCIEPWHSLPDRADASGAWSEKPCAAVLGPGECWSTELKLTFAR